MMRKTLNVVGMDCVECTHHVRHALEQVPGVKQATVLLVAEKAILELSEEVDHSVIADAVEKAGYAVQPLSEDEASPSQVSYPGMLWIFFLVAGIVLFVVVLGEWAGLFTNLSRVVPSWFYLALIILGGLPIFRNVLQALFDRQITSHALMTIGVIATMAIGEWATSVVIVLFMRIGDWVERQTTDGARRAIQELMDRSPKLASVEREGVEHVLPIDQIRLNDILIGRPGETLAADGEILEGSASLDASSVTGESVLRDVGVGSLVYSGSVLVEGGIRYQAKRVGADSTIGRVIQLVEEAEANKGRVQRFADRFSAYYLPLVLVIAAITYILRQDVLAAVAVLVVVCSCAIALATPIAMLASIGSAGKQGLVIKGGRYLELLPEVDVILLDKTGTLTLGTPQVETILPVRLFSELEILRYAAGVERYSEHPIGLAIRQYAQEHAIEIPSPTGFRAYPGKGAEAEIDGRQIRVGNQGFIQHQGALDKASLEGQTLVFVEAQGELIGVIGLADQMRDEIPRSVDWLRSLGYRDIQLLTGDREAATKPLAALLGIPFQAGLLPDDKIEIVRALQADGKIVAMIGDGINDAPALAQADVGIAMGATGAEIAIQAADIALLRNDWMTIPAIFLLARKTMATVRLNLILTAIYNLTGILLAAFGILPPVLAAAAQSIPDVGILANSSRLLRFRIAVDSS